MGQKGLKLAFLGQKWPFLADFFLNGIGGVPPPLTENQCEKKKVFFLNGIGGWGFPPKQTKSAKTFLTASLMPLLFTEVLSYTTLLMNMRGEQGGMGARLGKGRRKT